MTIDDNGGVFADSPLLSGPFLSYSIVTIGLTDLVMLFAVEDTRLDLLNLSKPFLLIFILHRDTSFCLLGDVDIGGLRAFRSQLCFFNLEKPKL